MSKGLGSLQPHFRAMFGTPCSLGMWQRWLWMPLVGKGPEKESPTCGVCCVGWGVRGFSLHSQHGDLQGAGLEPSPQGAPVISSQWESQQQDYSVDFFLPDIYLSDDNHYSPDLPPAFVGLNKLGALHVSCQPTGSPSCWLPEQQLKYKPIYLRE